MPRRLKTRINSSGYKQFQDSDGRMVLTHRRAAENKFGQELPAGTEVHHRDRDKTNNRHENLLVATPDIHRRLHHQDPDACVRCGRSGHWSRDCEARTNFKGDDIVELGAEEDEWDEDDGDDDEWEDDGDDEDEDDEDEDDEDWDDDD